MNRRLVRLALAAAAAAAIAAPATASAGHICVWEEPTIGLHVCV